jgi:pimeloyl-ACP methyl ester carboxylesterase
MLSAIDYKKVGQALPWRGNSTSRSGVREAAAPKPDRVEVFRTAAPAVAGRVAHAVGNVGRAIGHAATAVVAAARGIAGSIGHAIDKFATGVRFMSYGLIYKAESNLTEAREKKHHPLQNLPQPGIHRPFVLIPGWTTTPDAFTPLTRFLTQDGNNGGQTYYVKQGQFYTLDGNGQLQPAANVPKDAKVFEMVWSDTHQSPDRNVVEMRQNFAALRAVTGLDKFDCEGYSMGGLDARLYLDQGGDAMNRLMLLGTPNRGTEFGPLADNVITKGVKWAQKFGGLLDEDHDSLQWLTWEKKSAQLSDLNSRWAQQQAAVPIITVGCDRLPTASWQGVLGLQGGDGLVPGHSLELPNSTTLVLHEAMGHGRLNDDETVQHIRSIYFGWDLPPNADSLFPDYDAKYLEKVPRP